VVASWARALVPAAIVVVTPLDGEQIEFADAESAITVDVDDVASGPLSLAHAIAKAAGASD
jgi:hypothetical protein